MKEVGLKRTTVQTIINKDLGLKPFRQVKAHMVKPVNMEKRLAARAKWGEEIENGALGLKQI